MDTTSNGGGSGQAGRLIPTVGVVDLVERGVKMEPPPGGLVYSTDPRSCNDADGTTYVIKGPDASMVAAEAVGYLLARRIGVVTPPFALGARRGEVGLFFASGKLENVMRNPEPFLTALTPAFAEALVRIHLLDIWLANDDRNMGGFLVGSVRDGATECDLIAIDFEKSHAVRGPAPLITANTVDPKKLLPKGDLRAIVAGALKRVSLGPVLGRITSVSDDELETLVKSIENVMYPSFSWSDSVVRSLAGRRDAIDRRFREVWQ